MTPFVKLAAAIVAVAASVPALGQASSATDRAAGRPAGIAVPVLGAAAAEEPDALSVNPAGIGFVDALALQYFHEGGVTPDSDADGVWGAGRLGPLGVGLSMEWMRPGGDASRYRRTRLGLSLGDGHAASLAFAWTWMSSPDPAIAEAGGWDVALTLRPQRHLSIAAAMLDRDAPGLPVRYDFGLATRLLEDALTLSADLLADDRSRDDFYPTHVAFGGAVETRIGFALGVQIQVPVRDLPGAAGAVAGIAFASWNAPHSGVTGGAVWTEDRTGWLAGLRVSSERYRGVQAGADAARTVDVADELERQRFLFFDIGEKDPYGALVQRLQQAREDPDVAGLVLRIDRLPLGAGRIEELRTLVAAVAARKPVVAYLLGGDTREYWLATAATAIAAPPGAPIFVTGISTSQLYLRDTLARLGISFEVVKAGAYKSATEPLVRTEPSPEARQALEAVLDDVYGRFVQDVAAARRLPPERVRALVDEGLFTSDQARADGLVDEVVWPDQIDELLRRLPGHARRADGPYRPIPERAAQRWGRPPVIQIIRVDGMITQGKSHEAPGLGGVAGSDTVAAAIARAARDPQVKAIVLRIDSPGGDGLASDLIWRAVIAARRKGKPVVASLGDYAASGGYLVAVAADAIVAEPSTITGSIGVFAAKPDLSGLLAKLSVHRTPFTRGQNAQILSLTKPWTPSERAVLERQIAAFYATFLDRVAEGRQLPRAEVEAVAAGRVWTGRQALDRRLVDRLGTLADAVALARERAGLAPGDEVEIRREGHGSGPLARAATGAVAALAPEPPLERVLAEALPDLALLPVLLELGPVVALPEDLLPRTP